MTFKYLEAVARLLFVLLPLLMSRDQGHYVGVMGNWEGRHCFNPVLQEGVKVGRHGYNPVLQVGCYRARMADMDITLSCK